MSETNNDAPPAKEVEEQNNSDEDAEPVTKNSPITLSLIFLTKLFQLNGQLSRHWEVSYIASISLGLSQESITTVMFRD